MANSEKHGNKGVNPAAAALTGLAIGVVAGVAATALSDKDKRAKASKKLDDMGKQAKKSYDTVSEEVEKLKNKVTGMVDEAEETVSEAKESAKKAGSKAEESAKVIEAELEEVAEEGKKATKEEKRKYLLG